MQHLASYRESREADIAVLAGSTGAGGSVPGEVPMFDESAERRAILELGQALQEAWNRGDAAGYALLFTDDADCQSKRPAS